MIPQGPQMWGHVERTVQQGEGGHRQATGRLGWRLEGPQQLPGCRSPQTLTAGGTSPCEVAELVLSPGGAGRPADFTNPGAGPRPRCWSVWSGVWLGNQEATELPKLLHNATPGLGSLSSMAPSTPASCVTGSWHRPGEHRGRGETRIPSGFLCPFLSSPSSVQPPL